MKSISKVATNLYEFWGMSKQVARTGSEPLAKSLSTLLSGKSRQEKKAFVHAMETLTNTDKRLGDSTGVILRTFTKGQTAESYRAGLATYDAIVTRSILRRGALQFQKDIPRITTNITDSLTKSLTEAVTLKPETLEKIAKDAIKESRKETLKDAGIALYRVVASPVNLIRRAFIPKENREMFSRLVKLPKDKFRGAYYQKLLEQKGLMGRAPAVAEVTNKSAGLTVESILYGTKRVEGGFDPIHNTIKFTNEFNLAPRSVQANLITHELRHFEQADQIIRTFGLDRYINAHKLSAFKRFRANPKFAKESDKQLMNMVEDEFKKQNVVQIAQKAFAGSISAPKINPNSLEGQQAAKYLQGYENYAGIKKDGFLTTLTKEYLENPLEVEAYAVGKKVGQQIGIIEDLNFYNI